MNPETLLAQLRCFAAAVDGATAIEYALIACGVAGAIILTVSTLGSSVLGLYTAVAAAFGT